MSAIQPEPCFSHNRSSQQPLARPLALNPNMAPQRMTSAYSTLWLLESLRWMTFLPHPQPSSPSRVWGGHWILLLRGRGFGATDGILTWFSLVTWRMFSYSVFSKHDENPVSFHLYAEWRVRISTWYVRSWSEPRIFFQLSPASA